MPQKTLLLIKPDAVRRKLIGEILMRFERKGFDILAMKIFTFSDDLVNRHYEEHVGKDFFPPLKAFVMSGPCVAAVLYGINAVDAVRKIVGKTNPQEAAAGTIRGDYGAIPRENLVHASDSIESAKREIQIFFPDMK